ncbi:hypothetical protein [Phormidesmis priestleyi]
MSARICRILLDDRYGVGFIPLSRSLNAAYVSKVQQVVSLVMWVLTNYTCNLSGEL